MTLDRSVLRHIGVGQVLAAVETLEQVRCRLSITIKGSGVPLRLVGGPAELVILVEDHLPRRRAVKEI